MNFDLGFRLTPTDSEKAEWELEDLLSEFLENGEIQLEFPAKMTLENMEEEINSEEVLEMESEITLTERRNSVKDFIKGNKNKSTVKKTMNDMGKFVKYLQEVCHDKRKPEDIPPEELNLILAEFLISLRKKDGSVYEPDSLTAIFRSVKRFLDEKDYAADLLLDKKFQDVRDALKRKRKISKEEGKGNRPQKAEPLTETEEDLLWTSGQLSTDNPRALLNTMWFLNGKLFGLRGVKEHHQMRIQDVTLKTDENNEEFLELNERGTKTRTGLTSDSRPFNPKMFQDVAHPERCPVKIYKEFIQHRPVKMNEPDSPFYLGVKPKPADDVWFICAPLGHNTLSGIMKSMAAAAGLKGRKTNHSLRHTACNRLLNSGVAPVVVAQLSGHKNIDSLRNYSTADIHQQREMCSILQNSSTRHHQEPVPTRQQEEHHLVSTSSSAASTSKSSTSTAASNPMQIACFSGAHISGGVFNITINTGKSSPTINLSQTKNTHL